ncbi:sensor histidine kinase [Actinoplanes couchii]|uniref:histidine kinase n=1 Tax=Actinoplanes couchii TaxID=403638 RepID=A0ABQ3XEL0_9ACTN|nr:HAMP domain-containing sensor histidine kinase [Actinoplanes couchii]MDR6319803.1 two-component system sensor histidine kinase BaeS [Actinoplanes couchii]GID56938.1 two-component sensor histidine kinase [Actinoplanes couchii]
MPATEVPLHRSLLVRLLAASLTIAVTAIIATAWLTFRSTTQVIRQQQGQSLADYSQVYDTLIGYAAAHTDWTGAGPVVAELARQTNRRITLTTTDRTLLADSAPGPSLRDAAPSATVDPLRLEADLSGRPQNSIDPRAIGPYRVTGKDANSRQSAAQAAVACLSGLGVPARVVTQPNGRPVVRADEVDLADFTGYCPTLSWLATATWAEQRQLDDLIERTNTCLGTKLVTGIAAGTFTPTPALPSDTCLIEGRRAQLRNHVAPPALVFVTAPHTDPGGTAIDLSRPNLVRIFGVTGLVLALAIVVTVLAGSRLVRPLRALAAAAHRPTATRFTAGTRDEIGYLADALNDLTERREEGERQRRELVGDVAHELRSPLTNICSWLEGAQDGVVPLDPRLLDLLLDEAVLLQHIIDDLRDLAAADAGTLRLHREPADVEDLTAQVVEAHDGAARTAGVRLELVHAGAPQAFVDPQRLRQMIGNLVANAIRHTPAGGSVTVRPALHGDRLTITVTDTGVGISPSDLPRVFDRFWRADTSRSRATGGSGLGLSIVRKLAEAHGGTVTAASTLDAGSTFTIRLPAQEGQLPAA